MLPAQSLNPAGRSALSAVVLALLFILTGNQSRAATHTIGDGDVAGLIAALQEAKDGDIIALARAGVYTLDAIHNSSDGPNGLPVIVRQITIQGNGATIERHSDAPGFRIFSFENVGPETKVLDLTIKNGAANDHFGGGIYHRNSSPTVANCVFVGNRARNGGGMANLADSAPTVTDSIFEGNLAWEDGAAMFNENSSPRITNCIFKDGLTVWGQGGGMANFSGSDPIVTESLFIENVSESPGGGMANVNSSPIVLESHFEGNWSMNRGAGMANFGGSNPVVMGSVFRGNEVNDEGAAMYNNNSSPFVVDCLFDGNWGDEGSGMANVNRSAPVVANCRFVANLSDRGGAVYNVSDSAPDFWDCVFEGNRALEEGGGMFNRNSNPTVMDCRFINNQTFFGGGGGMANRDSAPVIVGTRFQGNSSAEGGGGMLNIHSDPLILDSAFEANKAEEFGGGIANFGTSKPTVIGATFKSNSAVLGGGGIFSDLSSVSGIGFVLFCGSVPDHLLGPWNDWGANQFRQTCGQSYHQWAQVLPPGLRGKRSDPGGFGIPNLLRYAFDMRHRQPERGNLPVIGQRRIESDKHLTFSYLRRRDDPDLAYQVEASDDLIEWVPFEGIEEVVELGPITETVTVLGDAPLDGQEKRFLRLSVKIRGGGQ